MLSTKKKSRIQEIKVRKYAFDQENKKDNMLSTKKKSKIQKIKVRKHAFDQRKQAQGKSKKKPMLLYNFKLLSEKSDCLISLGFVFPFKIVEN